MKTLLPVSFALLSAICLFATPDDQAGAVRVDANGEKITVAKLEEENELLRKENQALRRQVVALRSRLGASEAEKAAKDAKKDDQKADIEATKVNPDTENNEHWLSSGSKKRHNSSCRYFKAGKGSLCSEKDGEPCKVCGG